MAWLTGWLHAKDIVMTGQAGSGIDYQVELEISDSAGGDFHLEGGCTNFPQDIEVTDDDGTTLLDFWIEDITSDPIVMKVKVDDDLGSNQTIRIYYDKIGATTNSDGSATFPFFDDFSGDLSKWDTSGTPTIVSGKAVLNDDDIIVSKTRFGYGYCFEGYSEGDEQDINPISAYETVLNEHNALHFSNSDSPDPNVFDEFKIYLIKDNVWTAKYVYNWDDFRNVLKRYRIKRPTANDVTFEQESHSVRYTTGTIPTVDLGLGFRVWDNSQESTLKVDWGFVRKYNDPEPSFASAGAEQNAPTGAIMNQFQKANIGADLYNGVIIA